MDDVDANQQNKSQRHGLHHDPADDGGREWKEKAAKRCKMLPQKSKRGRTGGRGEATESNRRMVEQRDLSENTKGTMKLGKSFTRRMCRSERDSQVERMMRCKNP